MTGRERVYLTAACVFLIEGLVLVVYGFLNDRNSWEAVAAITCFVLYFVFGALAEREI